MNPAYIRLPCTDSAALPRRGGNLARFNQIQRAFFFSQYPRHERGSVMEEINAVSIAAAAFECLVGVSENRMGASLAQRDGGV